MHVLKIVRKIIILNALVIISVTVPRTSSDSDVTLSKTNGNILVCTSEIEKIKTHSRVGTENLEDSFLGRLVSFSDFGSCVDLLDAAAIMFKDLRENVPMNFLLFPNSTDNLVAELQQLNTVSVNWKRNKKKHLIWRPVIFVLFPEVLRGNEASMKNMPLLTTLQSSVAVPNVKELLSLDSQVYIVTTFNSGTESSQWDYSLWDIYAVGSELVIEKILSDTVTNAINSRIELELSTQFSWMSLIEKVKFSSFVARRHFRQLPLRTAGLVGEVFLLIPHCQHLPTEIYVNCVTELTNNYLLVSLQSEGEKSDIASFDYDRINETHVKFTNGYSVQLLWDLRDSLNFTVIEFVTHQYMNFDPSNGITGIGRQLVDDEMDLVIALHTILPWRAEYLDYLQPVHTETASAFFQQPPLSSVRNIFTWPFKAVVWLAIGVVLLLIVLSLMLTNQVHKTSALTQNEAKYSAIGEVILEDPYLELGEIFMLIVGVASLQGWKQAPNRKVTRLILISGLFLMFILYLCYSGSIISALTMKVTPISEYAHFAQHGYSLIASESAYSFYKTAPKRIETEKVLVDTAEYYVSSKDTMTKILADGSPFASVGLIEEHYYSARVLNISQRDLCQLSFIIMGPSTAIDAMFIQKGSPFKQFLNTKTILSIERGLNHVHRMQYDQNIEGLCHKASRNDGTETAFQDLSFSDSKLMIIVVFGGVILSLVLLVVENVMLKLERKMDLGMIIRPSGT